MGTYFTLTQLTNSQVAKEANIDNIPDFEACKRMEALIDKVLDPIRTKFGKPIIVNSGFRCSQLNSHPKIKGANNSDHKYGFAADITSSDNKALWKLINDMIKDGEIKVTQLIDEKNLRWIHISYNPQNLKNQILTIK